jgi:hypothetical protein
VENLVKYLLLALALACARVEPPPPVSQPAPPPPAPQQIRHVFADSAFNQFFANARNRQNGHSTLPDQEIVTCLYGVIRGDTAYLAFVRPTFSSPEGASLVHYAACAKTVAKVLGELVLLGTWHPHGPDSLPHGGCYFSTVDDRSFQLTDAPLDFVSCKDGLIWRSK